jgi:hypothetical protein
MVFQVHSPQATTYELAATDTIALCGFSNLQLSQLWTLAANNNCPGVPPGNPFDAGATSHGAVASGNWNVGTIPAGNGSRHVQFWYLEQGQTDIQDGGCVSFDVIPPGSGSGSGGLSSGGCPQMASASVWATAASAAFTPGQSVVITEAAARLYRLRFDPALLQLPEPAASLLAGEALVAADIVLSYDLARSTPLAALWHYICPATQQCWLLAVTRDADGQLHAFLSLTRHQASHVQPPFTWRCDRFSLQGRQRLAWCGSLHALQLPGAMLEPVAT